MKIDIYRNAGAGDMECDGCSKPIKPGDRFVDGPASLCENCIRWAHDELNGADPVRDAVLRIIQDKVIMDALLEALSWAESRRYPMRTQKSF